MGEGVQLARVPPVRFLLPYRCQAWKNPVCKLALCPGGVPRVGGGGMPPGVRYAHRDGGFRLCPRHLLRLFAALACRNESAAPPPSLVKIALWCASTTG